MAPPVYDFTFGQPWLETPDARLNPGKVHVEVRGESLEVEAHLNDPHIRDFPAKFNDLAFLKSDVLEVFLMAEGDDHYHEVHVTPSNTLLQLRYPCDRVPRTHAVAEKARVPEPALVESSTELIAGGWRAHVVCPLAKFTEQRPLPKRWHVAFCRYDYQEAQEKPVISTTAPLTTRNFHRFWEWNAIEIV